jgi:hypothetical protein
MASLPLAFADHLLWREPAPSSSPPFNLPLSCPAFLSEDDERTASGKLKLRTVWISDVHLGTPGCNADLLLDFLKSIQPETLYLVGDIRGMTSEKEADSQSIRGARWGLRLGGLCPCRAASSGTAIISPAPDPAPSPGRGRRG